MKANVLKRFKDKETRKVFEVDSVYEGEQSRVEKLQRLGYIGESVEGEPSILDGNVESVKQAVEGLDKDSLEKLFEKEMADKNRKGVLEYIEELLSAFEQTSGEGE